MENLLKKHKNIYALDKRGKLRLFQSEAYNGYFITRTGLATGKLTERKTLVKPKNVNKANETTLETQAIAEAQSKWNEKLDEGYKSLAMVFAKLPEPIFDGLDTLKWIGSDDVIEVSAIISNAYKRAGIILNSNIDWLPLSMKAQIISKVKDFDNRGVIQKKYNGVKNVTLLHEGNIVHMSSGGGYYILPHITKALETLFRLYPNIVLDGELYKHGIPLQTISGAARRESNFKTKEWLEYYIYDVISTDTQEDRTYILNQLRKESQTTAFVPEGIKFIQSIRIEGMKALKSYHDKFVSMGYEGAIYRPDGGMYESSFRSNTLIKIKEYIDEEFEIIGCEIDENKTIGDSFVFVLKNNKDRRQEFRARPTGTRAMKLHWYYNMTKIIGKIATVRFQERSEEGIPTQGHVQSGKSKLPVIEEIDKQH